MKICLIGGIYAKGGARSEYVKTTPETTLESGFRASAHDVTTLSHYDEADFGQFDVVHVHHLSYGAARLASDPSRTPFVFTAHDASLMNGSPLSRPRRLAMRYVMSRADGVVSLSEAEGRFQQNTYPLEGAVRATIANGVSPELFPFTPRSNEAPPVSSFRILFAGQLIPLKRCDLLFKALAMLPPYVELELVYQTATLEFELKALAGSLGISGRVKFLGKKSPAELASLYQTRDCLVLPSETEALPSVITEAMFSGLPFVATTVGGIPEQAGGFGVLVKPGSAESLATGLREVISNHRKFEGASQPMSNYARSKFSIGSMVQKHLEMYQVLAGRKPRRHSWNPFPIDRFVRFAVRMKGTGQAKGTRAVSTAGKQKIAEERL